MPDWLRFTLGGICAFSSLWQFRMTLIYMGLVPSTVSEGRQPALILRALKSAIRNAALSLVFFFVQWPQVLTYILAVLAFKAWAEYVLALAGKGGYELYAADGALANIETEDGRTARSLLLRSKVGDFAFYLITLSVVGYFFGFQ